MIDMESKQKLKKKTNLYIIGIFEERNKNNRMRTLLFLRK